MNLAIIIGAVVALMLVIAIVGLVVFLMMAKKKRATRGTYSPSRQVNNAVLVHRFKEALWNIKSALYV